MKNIITIQHTQSVQHTNRMLGGWADWDLTEVGIEQAKRIGKNLSQEIKDKKYIMYSSDLLRAKHTAKIVAEFLSIRPIPTAVLREINLGGANGKSKEWARENDLGQIKTIDDKQYNGAESRRELWNRLLEFHSEIMESTEENIIIVSHGITLGIFHAMWLGLDVEMLNKCGMQGSSGSVSFMHEDSDKKRIISRLGDRSYVR